LTIDPWTTFLHPQTDVFDRKGFTFTPLSPSSDNLPVRRNSINICCISERPWGHPSNLITIPALGSSEPFVITHHLRHYPVPQDHRVETPPGETLQDSVMRYLAYDVADQTCGLEAGETYQVGLGDSWKVVRFWRRSGEGRTWAGRMRSWWMGREDSRSGGKGWVDGLGGNGVPLILVNGARFKVEE
jgi:hypothetical protein